MTKEQQLEFIDKIKQELFNQLDAEYIKSHDGENNQIRIWRLTGRVEGLNAMRDYLNGVIRKDTSFNSIMFHL